MNMRPAVATSRTVGLPATLALTALTVVTVVGLRSVFTDWAYLGPMLIVGVGLHLIATLLRLLKTPLWVALPVMMPSILGTMILLFGNAFGAHATAYALTGGLFDLATLLIGRQISGDVLHNPGLGYAVAMGMVFIMAFLIFFVYSPLQRRSERWLR